VLSIILRHVHVLGLEFEGPFFLRLLHSGLFVERREGYSLLFCTKNELRDLVVLETVIPLSPTAQFILLILRQHHVDHFVIELQVLLLEADDPQQFSLGVSELFNEVLILCLLLVELLL